MPFKKVRMGNGMISRIEFEDETGRNLERWTTMIEDFPKVAKILTDKYGLEDIVRNDKKENKDLDWAI